MNREWMENNVIDTFSLSRDGLVFEFSEHRQDPKEDMSHIVVDLPCIFLVVRCMGYVKGIYLKASLAKKEIKTIAQEIVNNLHTNILLKLKQLKNEKI